MTRRNPFQGKPSPRFTKQFHARKHQRHAAQWLLKHREAEFDVIAKTAALMNVGDSLSEQLTIALELVSQVLQTDFLAIFVHHAAGVPVCAGSVVKRGDREAFARHCESLVDLPLLQCASRRRTLVDIYDVRTPCAPLTEEQMAAYRRLGVSRVAVKPILLQEKVLGSILLMRQASFSIPVQEISFMETFSDHVAILIENNRQKTKLRDLAVMEERRRLAHELHDSVTQSLFSLDMAAQSLRNTLTGAAANQALDLIEVQTRTMQRELRSLINALRPVELGAEETLETALQRHVISLRQTAGVRVDLQVKGNPRALPLAVQQALNRIAQEALSNVARHARAGHAWVDLSVTDEQAQLGIVDDGVGFSPERAGASLESYGLTSMRERVAMIGGSIAIESAPRQGTRITASISLKGMNLTKDDEDLGRKQAGSGFTG